MIFPQEKFAIRVRAAPALFFDARTIQKDSHDTMKFSVPSDRHPGPNCVP